LGGRGRLAVALTLLSWQTRTQLWGGARGLNLAVTGVHWMRAKLSLVVESEGCEVGVTVVVIIFFLGDRGLEWAPPDCFLPAT
jgi:hypothetical protein